MKYLYFLFLFSFFFSCKSVHKSKYGLENDYYTYQTGTSPKKKVYLKHDEDPIEIFDLDSNQSHRIEANTQQNMPKIRLSRPSFDLDITTTFLKMRPAQPDLPSSFQNSLNANLYVGYRKDTYFITFEKEPFGDFKRKITHLGFSLGGFSGFGGSPIAPWVTNFQILSEYDGIVWSKGVSAIFALNSFSVGLSLGFDNLLNEHEQHWIFENKAWVGLVIGLHLN